MITVADILALPAFDEVEPVAECLRANSRPVHNVGILDCPPDYNKYSVYYPGEFIVTNLGFANNDAGVAEESLCAMMARGVSAIAVKTVYDPPITDAVRRASKACGVPVYLYTGAFHEMVAYQALDLIRRDELESDRNDAITALLESRSGERIRRGIYDIASITGATMNCFAVAPKVGDETSLYAVLGMVQTFLRDAQEKTPRIDSTFACRYHGSVLGIISYGAQIDDSDFKMRDLAHDIAGSGALCCGVGKRLVLSNSDLSIRQALICLDEAKKRDAKVLSWGDLGKRAFSAAAESDPLFAYTCTMFRSLLQNYDEANGAELVATARALVQTLGDVKAAAEILYQHPNTVRYRLKRIKALFNMENSSDKELLSLLVLVFLA